MDEATCTKFLPKAKIIAPFVTIEPQRRAMEALNMLGLGAVLGPYQAVKDDVSAPRVLEFVARRLRAVHT
jgi:hypothetical protein